MNLTTPSVTLLSRSACFSPTRVAPVSFAHFQVSEHLRVAQERFCTTVPLFPRLGPLVTAFPTVISTIGALRLPMPNTGSLMDSLPRSTLRLPVYSLAAETAAGYGPIYIAPCLRACLERSVIGSPRFLRSPSCTFAPLSDPGRSGLASPITASRCRPQSEECEVTSI